MTVPSFENEAVLALWPLRSPTLPPATHTNCWVLGEAALTLVDPGSPWEEELNGLMKWIGDRTVERIFLTHHHHDHISGATQLQERTGAPIACHAETATRIPFDVQELWEEGEVLQGGSRQWDLIHTPGHARGHLCLHDAEDGTVIAGDMVAGEGTILLEPAEGDLHDYLHSLSRLLALNPSRLLPAHGRVLTPAIDTLQNYIDHRLMRTTQIVEAMGQRHGLVTANDLVGDVYTELDERFHPIASLQLSCHLGWLSDQGVVQRQAPDRYRLIDADLLEQVIAARGWQP